MNHILPTRLNTSVASSPFFKIFLMSQVKAGNRGFLSKHIGDIHHLFPKKYLQKNGLDVRGEYNQIANYVYTQSEINIKIKAAALCEYMAKVLKQIENKEPTIGGIIDKEDLMESFRQSCIPEEFVNYTIDDYKKFLEQRRLLMAQKIKDYYFNL